MFYGQGCIFAYGEIPTPPPNRIVECMWGMRIAIFDQYLAFRLSLYIQCVPKNETRLILNILYSCKFIAVKFSMQYPDGLS